VEQKDLDFLKLVERGDAEGVFQSVAADNDSRRICGYPPIYMTLRCIDKPMGKLIRYRQWSDAEAGAAVTFAAMRIF
jgi:predicted class III extradiol MEMO1 family dioxygenase